MPFYKYSIVYAASLLVFLAVDFIWLGLVAQPFYHRQLGELLSQRVNWPAAIAFYMIYIVGLMIFCVAPALSRASLVNAIVLGGLRGLSQRGEPLRVEIFLVACGHGGNECQNGCCQSEPCEFF